MLKGLLSAVLTIALYVSECVCPYPHVKLFPVTNKKNVPIFRKTIGVVSLHGLFVFIWTVPWTQNPNPIMLHVFTHIIYVPMSECSPHCDPVWL